MLADFPVDAPRYFLKFPVRQALPTSTAIKAGGGSMKSVGEYLGSSTLLFGSVSLIPLGGTVGPSCRIMNGTKSLSTPESQVPRHLEVPTHSYPAVSHLGALHP